MSRFSVESFSSHGTEKLRNGTLLCFRNFPLSKKFLDKHGRMGGITNFFQEERIRAVGVVGVETVTIFRQKLFVAQCRKSS